VSDVRRPAVSARGRSPVRRPPTAPLTVLELPYFQERIFVYVADRERRTDHSFYLAGQRFLTLHYEIERVAEARV
jgi:hypothetical protein